ncbi:glycosidase [Dyadobacter jejuensis]|uniref:Glycosidase n=2 Tax=Dyadobacter jejuensis TaxID=1082580 RepID=A0A316B8B5_9BACT|nr:glycosidase [Dyadobacter jejuensis]
MTINSPKICYEIFVRSFCDSNNDGIGDIQGITSKLDYLQDLGIEAIWLTPIHPSPSYHKYDVIDYYAVDPEFGSLDDLRTLIREAHRRHIAVILDLIINHTSTLHPWFLEAQKSSDNPFREYYWWKNDQEIEALGIATRDISDDSQEVSPWHEIPNDPQKYYGLFYKGMPDLNFHSQKLRHEFVGIMKFWLTDIGVDGFRIDAARHIFPTWESAHNRAFWFFFKETVESLKPTAFTVGEIWAGASEIAPYYKGLHATFNFDLSFAIQELLITENDPGLINTLLKTHALYEQTNTGYIDAIMLTNHDQERIASVVGGDTKKIKLAACILLTLPGQPYLYYGEEIGMLGTKPDPEIREPFIWSNNPADPAVPRWSEIKHNGPASTKALSEQIVDPKSVYSHYKELIALRRSLTTLGQTTARDLESVNLKNDSLLAFSRGPVSDRLLIIHNLSGKAISTRLPLQYSVREVVWSHQAYWNSTAKRVQLRPYGSLIVLCNPK